MNKSQAMLTVLTVMLFATDGLAQRRWTHPVEQVKLRATKIGYAKAARLRGERSSSISGLNSLYVPPSGLDKAYFPLLGTTDVRKLRAFASWKDRASCIAGQTKNVNARYDVPFWEEKLAKIDKVLAALPESVTGGFRLGKLYGNKLFDNPAQLKRVFQEIYEKADKHHRAKIERTVGGVTALESELVGNMDRLHGKQRPKVATKLKRMSAQQLYQHALTLVQQIDAAAHEKAIRHETVERGSAESRFRASDRSRFDAVTSDGRGVLTGVARGRSSGGASGASSSSYSRDQLLLHAARYTVNIRDVKHATTRAKRFTPVEARMLAGMVLEVGQVANALQKKDRALAAPLTRWLQHSEVAFRLPTGTDYRSGRERTEDYVVQLGHAQRDVSNLPRAIVSPAFARGLEREVSRPLKAQLTGSSLLD